MKRVRSIQLFTIVSLDAMKKREILSTTPFGHVEKCAKKKEEKGKTDLNLFNELDCFVEESCDRCKVLFGEPARCECGRSDAHSARIERVAVPVNRVLVERDVNVVTQELREQSTGQGRMRVM